MRRATRRRALPPQAVIAGAVLLTLAAATALVLTAPVARGGHRPPSDTKRGTRPAVRWPVPTSATPKPASTVTVVTRGVPQTPATTSAMPPTSTTSAPPLDRSPLPVTHVGGIPSSTRIRPTAIVLHWWASVSDSNIDALISTLRGQISYYDPTITRAQYDENMRRGVGGHELGVQFGVTQDGRAYQLTPWPDSYAAHAACANRWAIGIEIEGRGASDLASHPAQKEAVVRLVRALMRRYSIPVDGPLDPAGNWGVGVHSHKEVDARCRFADGTPSGGGKIDVDDAYLASVRQRLGGHA